MQTTEGLNVKIGLEVHCQLTALKTKLFCTCSSDYRSSEPNEKICPVCFGLPGTLPVLNAKAVEYATMIALALNCKVAERSFFYRKNYFYPDLPKGFQISQYDKAGGVAIASAGSVDVRGKRVRITRIQLEEDPGKLTYEGTIDKSSSSLVDYNRAGIALVEIVTEPDLEDAKEAKVFLEKLRSIIESLGVSNGELDGAMRCDANISLAGGARVEVKNISSFKEVEKALNYEILRQKTFSGNATSETRHWDERRSITISMRSKEEEQDYRYFPEPDLQAIVLEAAEIERIRKASPEVADSKAERYIDQFNFSTQQAREYSVNKPLSEFFEQSASMGRFNNFSEAASIATSASSSHSDFLLRVTPVNFADLMNALESHAISSVQVKVAIAEMVKTGESAKVVIESKKLSAVTDEATIGKAIDRVLSSKPELLAQAKADPKVLGYLIGQVRIEEPSAEPKIVAKLVNQRVRGK